jgi:hypothetical protein
VNWARRAEVRRAKAERKCRAHLKPFSAGQAGGGEWGTVVNHNSLLAALVRVFCSLIFVGIFYTGWMAMAIGVLKLGIDTAAAKAVIWLSAPVITGAGFAVGVAVFELFPGARKSRFLDIYKWSLIGCAIGAGIVFPFGPMLIVFGMFIFGTASVALRELMRI